MKTIIQGVIKIAFALALLANAAFAQPTPPGDGGTNVSGGGGGVSFNSPQYTTNDFYLQVLPSGANIYNSDSNSITVLLMGTFPEIAYEVLSTTNLQDTNTIWTVEQTLIGADGINFTPITVSMKGRSNLFLQALAYGLDGDGDGLPDWWQLKYFGHLGVNPYADTAGDGWNNLQKYQLGMNPFTVYPPPPPTGFTAVMDTNGNVTLHWSAAKNLPSSGAGTVTGYTIVTTYYSTNTVSASQTNYTDLLANSPGNQAYFQTITNVWATIPWPANSYSLRINYANVNSQTALANANSEEFWNVRFGRNFSVQATVVRGSRGKLNLVASAMPTNVAAIRVYYSTDFVSQNYPINSFYYQQNAYLQPGGSLNIPDSYFDVPVTSFTNGVAVFSDSQLPLYGQYQFLMIPIDNQGHLGSPSFNPWPGMYPSPVVYNIPFMDGRVQIAQNLAFLFRAADSSQPFSFVVADALGDASLLTYPNSYLCAGFHGQNFYYVTSDSGGNLYPSYVYGYSQNEFAPFEDNYMLRNFALSATGSNLMPDGELLGVHGNMNTYPYSQPQGGLYVTNQAPFSLNTFNYVTNGLQASIPVVLGVSVTQWLASPDNYSDYPWSLGSISIFSSSSTNFYMTNNATNIFGLAYASTAFAYSGKYGEIYPNGSAIGSNVFFYPDVVQPQFQTVDYYFGRPVIRDGVSTYNWNNDPAPSVYDGSFTTTNTTPYPFIIPFASAFNICAWAKQAVAAIGNPTGAIGYAEEYFDQAYLADSHGNITTNSAGILSEYGDFFPTQPGKVFLTTKPDEETSSTGQCVVNVIKLQLDVNHDGVMDLSFAGPDNTSPDHPFVFWLNNNFDRSTPDSADGTSYEDDVLSAGSPQFPRVSIPDCYYTDANGNRTIPTQRDLEDFARLWIVGLSGCLAILPASDIVTLSWEDYAGVGFTNDPTIDVFQAADADGGIGYLTNSATASLQTNTAVCQYVGRIAPGQGIQLNASQFSNSWAGDHFIWCGVQPGTGQLAVTVSDTNGNIVLETYAYIQVRDIKDMYERWTVGDNPKVNPTNQAVLACNDLPRGRPEPFHYAARTDTNTPYILYVHGWNMEMWEKDRFAETAFKRLYWQGYQGRFGSFRWPTGYGFTGPGSVATNINEKDNYDNSEFQAWQSGNGLLNKLEGLNTEYPGNVYLLAHSMGNVVAGEALRLSSSRVVNSYVASQGAVSAHTYDSTVPDYSFTYIGVSLGPETPNIYGNWFAGNYGGAASSVVNFYNTNDYALARNRWQLNQLLKPDRDVLEGTNTWTYSYTGSPTDGSPWNNFIKTSSSGAYFSFFITTGISDRYEAMAYAAQSYTTALGATPVGTLATSVNLATVWPPDNSTTDPTKKYSAHFWHSAEFRGDNAAQGIYWTQLLGSQAFNLK